MIDVGASAVYLIFCFLFSCLSVGAFIAGFKFGKSTVIPIVPIESGYIDYPKEKYKAVVPGKAQEQE